VKVSKKEIDGIKIPTLCLYANDDPIVKYSKEEKEMFKGNGKVLFAETAHGSHLCWYEGV
jgi:predicted alpha/beta-fold hydrolase